MVRHRKRRLWKTRYKFVLYPLTLFLLGIFGNATYDMIAEFPDISVRKIVLFAVSFLSLLILVLSGLLRIKHINPKSVI